MPEPLAPGRITSLRNDQFSSQYVEGNSKPSRAIDPHYAAFGNSWLTKQRRSGISPHGHRRHAMWPLQTVAGVEKHPRPCRLALFEVRQPTVGKSADVPHG
jgi:hypothetical protein